MATRKKKARSRRLGVNLKLQAFQLSKAGTAIELDIADSGKKLGHLKIGRGSITWRGADREKEKRYGWFRFAKLMNQLAYGE